MFQVQGEHVSEYDPRVLPVVSMDGRSALVMDPCLRSTWTWSDGISWSMTGDVVAMMAQASLSSMDVWSDVMNAA